MSGGSTEPNGRALWGVLLAVTLAKLAFAASFPLAAGEAESWAQAQTPGLNLSSYAALLRFTGLFGDGALWVRLPAICCGLAVAGLLLPLAQDRALAALLGLTSLPLLVGTLVAGPDATVLLGAALALAGAAQGGRGWVLAGLGGAFAAEAGLPGVALLPLLVVGSGDARSGWALLGLLLAAPSAWLSVAPLGPPSDLATFFLGQLQWGAGLLGLAAFGFAFSRAGLAAERARRLAWWGSAPILGLAAIGAAFGEHVSTFLVWPALVVGLASLPAGPLQRLVWTGGWLSALLGLGLALQVHRPVALLPEDPGLPFSVGPVLAGPVRSWATPVAGEGAARPVWVLDAREGALLAYHARVTVELAPRCVAPAGPRRRVTEPARFWSVQPAKAPAGPAILLVPDEPGARRCVAAEWPELSDGQRLIARDEAGRWGGSWLVFEVEGR